MKDEILYLDHAAATPLDGRVLAVMQPYFSDDFFNPSAPYMQAVEVRRAYEEAKDQIGRLIGGQGDEIIMTAGATESINLAIRGVGGHVVVANVEHHAVLAAAKLGEHTIIKADEFGRISPEAVKAALTPETRLVSVGLANNELGTIQPLRQIAEIIKEERSTRLSIGNKTPIYLHSDASQGVGQIDINVARLGVDMLTLNAGKIYGPKQVGLLWMSGSVGLEPSIVGGGQERGLRSGTENVAGTIGFAKALMLVDSSRHKEVERLTSLRDSLETRLVKAFPEAVCSGSRKHRLAGHLHISFPGLDGERLVFALEARKVLAATGSACAANKGTRSHVLTAIGLPEEVADGSLRITLGHLSTEENIEKVGDILIEEITKEYERIQR